MDWLVSSANALQVEESPDNMGLDIAVVEGIDLVKQDLRLRLTFFAGECFWNTDYGVRYYSNVFSKFNELSVANAAIKEVILGTDDVVSLLTFYPTYDAATRTYNLTFSVATTYGVAELNGVEL